VSRPYSDSHDLLSVYLNRGVIPFSEGGGLVHKPSEDLSGYQFVQLHDLVLNNQQAWRGSVGVSSLCGNVSPAYVVLEPRGGWDATYLNYLSRSQFIVNQLEAASRGVGDIQRQVSIPLLKNVVFPKPPMDQQKSIADFLDRETAQIDNLIVKQELLNDLLGARLRALRENVVTLGIGQETELKETGIRWLGKVPINWETKPLKRAFSRIKRDLIPNLGIVTAFRDGEVTLRSKRRIDGFTEADDYSGWQRIEAGDLAIHAMDAFAGSIGVSDSRGMCSPVLSICSPLNGNESRYMAYALRVMAQRGWIEALSRSIRERTSEFRWQDAGAQVVPIPPLVEQQEIVDFLDAESTQTLRLIERSKQVITLLLERRQALISDVVTGKIEVRG
jgi:type I restriction enzyme S subunit